MKVITFSVIFASASAVCSLNEHLLSVQCNSDLTIQIDISLDCLKEYYPDISITDLRFAPFGLPANQCTPCINSSPSCHTASNYYSNQGLTDAVQNTTSSLFFKATQCGANFSTTAINDTISFDSMVGTYLSMDQLPPIVSQAEIAPLKFTCTYNATIDGIPLNVGTLVIESPFATGFNDTTSHTNVLAELVNVEIQAEKINGSILLGTLVNITFSSIGNLNHSYFIDNCEAHNDNGDNDITLINNGCAKKKASSPLSDIDTTIEETSFTINQFAFIEEYIQIGNKYFQVQTGPLKQRKKAHEFCINRNMGLPYPKNEAENKFFQSINQGNRVWLAIADWRSEGNWEDYYYDDMAVNYQNWGDGYPSTSRDKNIAFMDVDGTWQDTESKSKEKALTICVVEQNEPISLQFNLICSLKFGNAPNCNQRSSLVAEIDSSATENFYMRYQVSGQNGMTKVGDIAVQKSFTNIAADENASFASRSLLDLSLVIISLIYLL